MSVLDHETVKLDPGQSCIVWHKEEKPTPAPATSTNWLVWVLTAAGALQSVGLAIYFRQALLTGLAAAYDNGCIPISRMIWDGVNWLWNKLKACCRRPTAGYETISEQVGEAYNYVRQCLIEYVMLVKRESLFPFFFYMVFFLLFFSD